MMALTTPPTPREFHDALLASCYTSFVKLWRIMFSGLAGVSALLCVATCVLGIRSYWYYSVWQSHRYWNTGGRGHRDSSFAVSWRGGLCYSDRDLLTHYPLDFRVPQVGSHFDVRGEKMKSESASTHLLTKDYGGFGFQHLIRVYPDAPKETENDWGIALPYWFVAALFGLAPAGWWLAFRRARLTAWRLRHMHCVHCGYDLRASVGNCPECGAVSGNQTS